jgi:AbrB family looped-hinge helix DNA binding protein
METVRLSTKGQIVIPKSIRDTHHLTPGTEFFISFVDQEIRLVRAQAFPKTRVEQGLGILQRKGRSRLRDADLEGKIGQMLKASDRASKR